jgi:hypothetical protein
LGAVVAGLIELVRHGRDGATRRGGCHEFRCGAAAGDRVGREVATGLLSQR